MNGKPLRGPRSDGAATRARILESAGTLFASQGLTSTTSKAIAAKAEVEKEKAKQQWLAKVRAENAKKEAAAGSVDEDVPQTENDSLPVAIPPAAGSGD